MAKGFVYHGKSRTVDDINKKAKEGSRDYDNPTLPGLPMFKPREGENTVRVLPSPLKSHPDWDLTVYLHYGVGPDNARYLCLAHKDDGDGRCPVCEAGSETDDDDEKYALRAGKATICWVIDRDDEKAGPQLWFMPFTKVRNEIYARSQKKSSNQPILIDDPEEGCDVSFYRKGTGERTQYTGVEISRDESPLHENEKIQDRWLDYISEHPLPEVLNWYSYEHIKKALYGKATRKKDEDDEDEAPRSRRRLATEEDEEDEAPRSRRSSRSDPDEEEEAPPSRRSRRSQPDADEEEPAPRSRRKSASEPEEEEDEPPFDKGTKSKRRALLDEDGEEEEEAEEKPRGRHGHKRKAVEEEEEPEEEAEEEEPSASARRQLGKLRPRNKR